MCKCKFYRCRIRCTRSLDFDFDARMIKFNTEKFAWYSPNLSNIYKVWQGKCQFSNFGTCKHNTSLAKVNFWFWSDFGSLANIKMLITNLACLASLTNVHKLGCLMYQRHIHIICTNNLAYSCQTCTLAILLNFSNLLNSDLIPDLPNLHLHKC